MNTSIVYFNGRYTEKENVRISPDDRGFLFADSVYEVVRSYQGHLFMFDEHMLRLQKNLDILRIDFKELEQIKPVMLEIITRNDLQKQDVTLYLQITRGAYPQRTLKFPEGEINPTIYIYVNQIIKDMSKYRNGIKVVSVEDKRWGLCHVKTTALVSNVLAQQEAIEKGGDMGVFIKNGLLTEGTHTSVFGIKNGVIYTHPTTNHILPSITRLVVMKLCKHLDIRLVEKAIDSSHIDSIDELFVVGTTPEVAPVIQFNNILIGKGSIGKTTQKLQIAFDALKAGKL